MVMENIVYGNSGRCSNNGISGNSGNSGNSKGKCNDDKGLREVLPVLPLYIWGGNSWNGS